MVGAPFEDDATTALRGVVYVFNSSTGQLLDTIYNPQEQFTSFTLEPESLAISDSYAIAGAEAGGTGAQGTVWVFN